MGKTHFILIYFKVNFMNLMIKAFNISLKYLSF